MHAQQFLLCCNHMSATLRTLYQYTTPGTVTTLHWHSWQDYYDGDNQLEQLRIKPTNKNLRCCVICSASIKYQVLSCYMSELVLFCSLDFELEVMATLQ